VNTVTTWLDGRIQTVPTDDPRLHDQKMQIHVLNLRRLTLADRRAYLDNLERKHGQDERTKTEAAFLADWQARKATTPA